mmetsp:Transcript_12315/g.51822  ORF Transcript_12315/g.51822 Transcript_12315/m.51822 type:complete len:275 (-) Transcript_12315:425-1249(-)
MRRGSPRSPRDESPPDDSDAGAAFRSESLVGDPGAATEEIPDRSDVVSRGAFASAPSSPSPAANAGGRSPRISAISALTSSAGGASGGGTTKLSASTSPASFSSESGAAAASGADATAAATSGGTSTTGTTAPPTGPPSTGLIVPRRANQSPHALHSERTPLGPRRMSGVAWLVHPQFEHARPPFLELEPRGALEEAGAVGGGRGGRTGATSRSTRRASSSAMHRAASRAFAAPSGDVATRRRPSPSAPHWTKCAPAWSTQTSSGSLKRRPSAR